MILGSAGSSGGIFRPGPVLGSHAPKLAGTAALRVLVSINAVRHPHYLTIFEIVNFFAVVAHRSTSVKLPRSIKARYNKDDTKFNIKGYAK